MEQFVWPPLLALAVACGAGFTFLFSRYEKNKEAVEALGREVDINRASVEGLGQVITEEKKAIAVIERSLESKPDFMHINNEFYRKEMAQIQIENIKQSLTDIKNDQREIKRIFEEKFGNQK